MGSAFLLHRRKDLGIRNDLRILLIHLSYLQRVTLVIEGMPEEVMNGCYKALYSLRTAMSSKIAEDVNIN